MARDFEAERARFAADPEQMSRNYELPDATTISIGADRFEAPEILFQPQIAGHDDLLGLHELTCAAIGKVDTEELRIGLFENVVLSGGSSVLPGARAMRSPRHKLTHLLDQGLENECSGKSQ